MIVEFEGQKHDFPDNFSQDDIAKALSTYKPEQGPLDRAGQEIAQTFKGGVQAVTDLGGGKPEDYLGPSGMLRSAKETGRAILGPVEATLGAVGSGIASLGASGLGAAQRGLEKGIAAGTEYFSPQTAEKMRAAIPSSQQAYETALPYAHAALGAVRGAPTVPRAPSLPPPLSTSQQAVEAAARGGYTLPKYAATEGTVIPQVASGLKNVPWGGQPIVRTHDELLANMGRSAGEIAPSAGTPETAGQAAKSGLTGFIKAESQKPISDAYKAVDELINPDVRVPLDNTRDMIGQIMAERTRARIPGQSKAVQTVFDAVQDPRGMDYAGTKSLRSFLGEKSPMELASQGLAPTEVKRIYGAMSKDLGNVVREAGGPEAFSAWKEANALTRLTKLQQQALSKVVGAEGEAAPEQVFNRLVTYANSKAGADLNRLRLAKKAMGPDAWNEISSALIARLGRAPDEAFSPQRFVTAFGNMAPAARNELFSGQQQAALADLFTVSKHIHDRITRFGNPSGTARGSFIGQAITGSGLWADPISTLTTLVGARVASAALARPAVVRAATRVARASLTGNPYAKQRAMAALLAVVQAEGLLPKQQDQQQQLPRMQYGGRPTGPTVVGEDGPEVFVPDQPGTVVPADDPWARAAARTARGVRPPGGRQEGAGTAFAEGGYGIPAAYRALDRSAQDAFGASNELTWGADPQAAEQAAGTMFKQSIGAAGAPLVAPAMEGAVLGAGAIRRAAPGIRAYHGSPHDFERFDLSKIGTGEGAQAYGHGLYFAENPAVAQSYKQVGTKSAPIHYEGDSILAYPRAQFEALPEKTRQALSFARNDANIAEAISNAQAYGRNDIAAEIERLRQSGKLSDRPSGRMYEVNINADPAQFLDWDKTLAGQAPQVRSVLEQMKVPAAVNYYQGPIPRPTTGEEAYRALEIANHQSGRGHLDRAMASSALQEAGIPGIKYLDQGSRGAKEGTSNYVLFRDDIIDIVKKYGLAGAATMLGIGKDEARAAMGRGRPKEGTP